MKEKAFLRLVLHRYPDGACTVMNGDICLLLCYGFLCTEDQFRSGEGTGYENCIYLENKTLIGHYIHNQCINQVISMYSTTPEPNLKYFM